jgi:C1A family cysteine protease
MQHKPKTRSKQWYGWQPDLPDHRDFQYKVGKPGLKLTGPLPPVVDLRTTGNLPPVYDQGELGSCTANALAALFQFVDQRTTQTSFMPSRLFIYYNERVIEDCVLYDSGAQLRDGITAIVKQGVCVESQWPYDPVKFTTQPSTDCYTQALFHQATVYLRIDNTKIGDIKSCLAQGFPIAAGFTVYSAFESDTVSKTGILSLPQSTEQILGGHAILIVGYDDTKQVFIVRNSWGTDWGDRGYFYAPYTYFTNSDLATDFWTIRAVEG